MNKEEFINLFIEELTIEEEGLTGETELASLEEWDSIGRMLTIGIASGRFDSVLTSDDLKALTTIDSLIAAIGEEKFDK